MKKIFLVCMIALMCASLLLCACSKKSKTEDLWNNAMYLKDAEIGMGKTCIYAEVTAQDRTVTLKVNTDKKTLGDALTEHKLISGEKGPYGLYVKFVNGIEADYDKNACFWAVSKEGESLLTGVDSEKISDGTRYQFVYTAD